MTAARRSHASAMDVLTVADLPTEELQALAARYQLRIVFVDNQHPIPGSFWGEPEAGIIGSNVYVRYDTPLHSLLHELCHVICMDAERRSTLHGNAGADDAEESAVCYLQVLLADNLADVGRQRLMLDMDAWGYSFRLGSTQRWFEEDASDARSWLRYHALLTDAGRPSFQLRER